MKEQPRIAFEGWDGPEDHAITVNGKPIGQSGWHKRDAQTIVRWLQSAYSELLPALSGEGGRSGPEKQKAEGLPGTPGQEEPQAVRLQQPPPNADAFSALLGAGSRYTEANWDGYGAAPLDPSIVEAARGFLRAVSVVPTVCGGIQLEWHMLGADLEVEFNPGEVTLFWLNDPKAGECLAVPSEAPRALAEAQSARSTPPEDRPGEPCAFGCTCSKHFQPVIPPTPSPEGLSRVTRFEVIDEQGRAYVRSHHGPVSVELSFQDDGRTLKVFVKARPTVPERQIP